MKKEFHTPKEISWLAFNERVLQEAADPTVPLIERIKFLGIFSSNRDEYYRVRVATIRRLTKIGKTAEKIFHHDPMQIFQSIQRIIMQQSKKFDKIYNDILIELEKFNIYIVNEKKLSEKQKEFVDDFFLKEVRPLLVPIMFTRLRKFPELVDKMIYLVVSAGYSSKKAEEYALIEVPTDQLSRFVILPSENNKNYIILLDDVIRHNLSKIFHMFDYTQFDAYTIKLTRDAELDIDDDISESYIRKVSRSIKKRATGNPVRFVYDVSMPKEMLNLLIKKLNISKDDTPVAGGRYHNFKDFMSFPAVGQKKLVSQRPEPFLHPEVARHRSMWKLLQQKDILLHFPYHTYNHFIDLLREAAIDPAVESIHITLYRVAKKSKVVNALINAVRNGKAVTAVIELQARFDEAANIYWADHLREMGVKVIFGVPDLKVHAKVCLIMRKEGSRLLSYVTIGTGNFNEDTARLYTDHMLMTSNLKITREANRLFEFFEHNYKISSFSHLVLSPFDLRKRMYRLIDQEIKNAEAGLPAFIKIKLNNFADMEMGDKLYQASQAGVKIQMIVRSMFSIITGIPGVSENIEAISIVDKYLEHTRIIIFANGGDEKVFIGSADWMTRNIDRRIEVTTPIFDSEIKKELISYFDIQWQDNVKARLWDKDFKNEYRSKEGKTPFRSQEKIYEFVKSLANESVKK